MHLAHSVLSNIKQFELFALSARKHLHQHAHLERKTI